MGQHEVGLNIYCPEDDVVSQNLRSRDKVQRSLSGFYSNFKRRETRLHRGSEAAELDYGSSSNKKFVYYGRE